MTFSIHVLDTDPAHAYLRVWPQQPLGEYALWRMTRGDCWRLVGTLLRHLVRPAVKLDHWA